MARPKKYTKSKLREIAKEIDAYVEKPPNGIPSIAECCYLLGEKIGTYRRQFFYEHDDCPEFLDSVKKLIAKKEYMLEMGGLSGKLNTSVAIFSLKQLGWTDKQEHSLAGSKDGSGPKKVTIEWE